MGVPKWKQRPEYLVFAEPLRKLIWIQFPYFHRHVVVTIDIFVTTSANYLNNSNILPFNHAAEQISAIMEIGTNRSHLSIDRISGRHWIQSLINWILAVKLARKKWSPCGLFKAVHWFTLIHSKDWIALICCTGRGGRGGEGRLETRLKSKKWNLQWKSAAALTDVGHLLYLIMVQMVFYRPCPFLELIWPSHFLVTMWHYWIIACLPNNRMVHLVRASVTVNELESRSW